jgi:hypothetical protein
MPNISKKLSVGKNVKCKLSTRALIRKRCVLTDYDEENRPELCEIKNFKCYTKKSKKLKKKTGWKVNCKLSTKALIRKRCVLTDHDDENRPELCEIKNFKCYTKKLKKSAAASKKNIINISKKLAKKNNFTNNLAVLRNFKESSLILGQTLFGERRYIRLGGANYYLIITSQYFETQNFDQYPFGQFQKLTSGTFNTIYKIKNNLNQIRALRVEIVDSAKKEKLIERFKKDARLYVRLSALKIIPKIHSIFFAGTSRGETALCSISDLAEGGSVSDYLQSEDYYKLGREKVEEFATKLRSLYKRLAVNHIVCSDVKTLNAVVSFEKNKIPTPYLIDFDTDHCSSKESAINFDVTLKKINDLLLNNNLGIRIKGVTKKELLDIYFHYMILQVACFIESFDTGGLRVRRVHKHHNAFVDAFLGEEMSPKMYTVLSLLIVLEIGDGKRKPMRAFDGYFGLLRKDNLFREHLRKNPDEYLRIAFMYAKEGEEKTRSYARRKYKSFFLK